MSTNLTPVPFGSTSSAPWRPCDSHFDLGQAPNPNFSLHEPKVARRIRRIGTSESLREIEVQRVRVSPSNMVRSLLTMKRNMPMQIAVVGSGYVGLVAGACFADLGHNVILVDNDQQKLAALRNGQVPIHERYLPELLTRHRGNRLTFSDDLKEAVGI